jgi:hypothetical protein
LWKTYTELQNMGQYGNVDLPDSKQIWINLREYM